MTNIEISPDILSLFTSQQAWHYKILPKSLEGDTFTFYIGDKENSASKDEIQMLTGRKVQFEIIQQSSLTVALSRYYRKEQNQESRKAFHIQSDLADDFLIRLVNEAQQQDSSDIHIESYESKGRIRFRIDGLLVERYTLSKEDYPSLVNKIKIKSSLDISEKRLPQDGRILLKSGTSKLDLRVSILPTMFGEKIVLRLLNSDIYSLDLAKCGFDEGQMQLYEKAIMRPNGIILISGPTGSGKTTTLYSTLKLLNKSERNIVTIEDPIEYTLDGVNQVQLKESIGLTFPKALRTFLRQDPDIIMVGEIRDRETAEMAIRASLTGHLVLSTIHTRSALGTINRLIDMGIPSFLIADTLNLSVAQRLIRLLCVNCKTETEADSSKMSYLFNSNGYKLPQYVHSATGCDKCFYTGYKGRKGLFEIVEISEDVKVNIKSGSLDAGNMGYVSLKDSVYRMVLAGETSVDEALPLLIG